MKENGIQNRTEQSKSKTNVGEFFASSRVFTIVVAPLILLFVDLVFLGDVLFLSGDRVLSKEGTDLFSQFIYFRDFGFRELKAGNLALWNPHLFSGMPFLGGFQSALLYPPNWIYLILPLAKAINAGIALHLFLGGIFMYLWALHRGLHPVACLFSGILVMFSGPYFLHVYAGHLPNLCTMVWAPLVLLAVDGLAERRPFGWCLLGIFAVTMQILAGHLQYVFYTGVTSVIYSGLLMVKNRNRRRIVVGLLCIYIGAGALSAVQLLSGIEAGAESVRSGGVSYGFAAMFSFPPENLVTLLVPGFFGDMASVEYWGRCYLWEMSLFVSVTGFLLAIFGAASGDRNARRFSITMVLILLILALGAHTPLFRILYSFVPGFDKFRGSSKFIFFASLYLLMLSAIGLDRLIRVSRVQRGIIISLFVVALVLALLAGGIQFSAGRGGLEGIWRKTLMAIHGTGESYLPAETYRSPAFASESGLLASRGLLISSGICALLGIIFFLMRFSRRAVYLLVLLAVGEILYFAKGLRPTFELRSAHMPETAQLSAEKGDYRLLNLVNPNTAMSHNIGDIWGYDPGVLRRYAEFMTFTQGGDPDKATQYVQFSRYHKLYKMLRCRYIIGFGQGKIQVLEFKDPMPRVCLIDNCRVISDRDQIFSGLSDIYFDPRETVILETSPKPAPVRSENKGTVSVVEESTDQMTIKADLPSPKILLITDAYSQGWRIRPLPGSAQKTYQVLPANYVLRAIPLGAGHHSFVLEYSPKGFLVGKWISMISLVLYIGILLWYLCHRRMQGNVKTAVGRVPVNAGNGREG